VKGLTAKGPDGIEGAMGDPALIPNELLPFLSLIHVFLRETSHFFALAAKDGHVHAGVEIILLDPDGGFLRIDFPAVEQGTNNFAEMATGATRLIDFDFHHLNQDAQACVSWGFRVRPSHEAGNTHRASH
jgi:hypothetical protein